MARRDSIIHPRRRRRQGHEFLGYPASRVEGQVLSPRRKLLVGSVGSYHNRVRLSERDLNMGIYQVVCR